MKHIINKMVYSLSAPINKNVVWIKPTGNGTFEMRIYYNNTWVPISSGGSGVTEEEDTQPSSPNLVCVYDITDTSRETQILHNYGLPYVTNMIVDGVEMDVDSYYQFDTVGNHVIEFVLDDPTTIGHDTFKNCTSLTGVTIPDGVTIIDYNTFTSCSNLTSVIIPGSVTSLESEAFRYCSSLTSVTIPNSVTTIGSMVFCDCTSLTSITIPDSVTEIGNYAFGSCTSLTSITIGRGVTSIGEMTFNNCSLITSIICYATTAPSIRSGTFNMIRQDGTLYVPTGSDYSSWMIWDNLGHHNWTIQYI